MIRQDRFNTLSDAIRATQGDGLVRVLYRTKDGNWHTQRYPARLTDPTTEADTIRYILPCGEVTKLS